MATRLLLRACIFFFLLIPTEALSLSIIKIADDVMYHSNISGDGSKIGFMGRLHPLDQNDYKIISTCGKTATLSDFTVAVGPTNFEPPIQLYNKWDEDDSGLCGLMPTGSALKALILAIPLITGLLLSLRFRINRR